MSANESSEGLVITITEGVATVKLDRPQRRNAIDGPTAIALTQFFRGATGDRSIRSILLTGSGRDFCSGADAVSGQAPPSSPLDYRYLTEDYRSLFQSYWEVEKPVVSAVNGTVAGAGWMLALLADLVVADADARWTHVFSRRGMVPHAGDPTSSLASLASTDSTKLPCSAILSHPPIFTAGA